jgi:hypothetical protein
MADGKLRITGRRLCFRANRSNDGVLVAKSEPSAEPTPAVINVVAVSVQYPPLDHLEPER